MTRATATLVGAVLAGYPTAAVPSPLGEPIPETLLGANCQSCEAGWATGLIPEAERGRRDEFAGLLRDYGIGLVRLPGGTLANRYFWDSEARTREVARILGGAYWTGHPSNHMYNYYVSFEESAAFCRDAGIALIWQLNTATIHDDEGVHLLAVSPTGTDMLPAVDFDHGEKLPVAIESLRRFARRIVQSGLPVPLFEMGNEEYALPALAPERYSEIVRAYIDVLREEIPGCTIMVTLGSNETVTKEAHLQWAEALLSDLAERGYADRIDYFTMHYAWRSVCEFASDLLEKHGFSEAKIAVTEFTCGWPEYWDKTPRYRHAVQVAEFLMGLMAVPRVRIAAVHDLLSQNFGIFHYNQRSFEPPDDRSYDGHLGYVPMPTATTYRLLRPLAGAKLLSASARRVEAERDGAYLAVLAKTTDAPLEQHLRPAAYALEAAPAVATVMTGESAEAVTAQVAEHELLPQDGEYTVTVPALSVVCVATTAR